MKLEKEIKIDGISYNEQYNKAFISMFGDFTRKEYEILKDIFNCNNQKITFEVDEPILDEAEKKYLSGVIAPFRNRIIGIYKYNSVLSDYEEIAIDTNEDYNCNHMTHLPPFKKGTMYKNLEPNKKYSLKDLSL